MLASHALRGLLALTLCCNVLSMEVQELAATEAGVSEKAGFFPDPEGESAGQPDLEDHAMKIYRALEAGAHNELVKEATREMKEAFPDIDGHALYHEQLEKYGDLTTEESHAINYFQSLSHDYEQLTGKKIEVGDFTAGEELPGPESDTAAMLREMEALSLEMTGGKPYKAKDDIMVVNNHQDFMKELAKLNNEKHYAFDGFPEATHPGGAAVASEPSDTNNENLPSMEESARQSALKSDAPRDKDKALNAETAKFEAEEKRKLSTEAAEADMPMSEVTLLQMGADPKPASEDATAKTKTDTGAKETSAKETSTKETSTKETSTKETSTKETSTKETGTKETGTKETKTAFANMHAHLDEVKKAVSQQKTKLASHVAETATASKADEHAAVLAAKEAEDAAVEAAKIGKIEEVVCPDPNDLACMRKRVESLALKTKTAKHLAYDLSRKAAFLATQGAAEKEKKAADNDAEQESVYAAFVSSQLDRARQAVVRLMSAGHKKEVAQKTAIKKALKAKRLASGQFTDPTRIPISFDENGQAHAEETKSKKSKEPAVQKLATKAPAADKEVVTEVAEKAPAEKSEEKVTETDPEKAPEAASSAEAPAPAKDKSAPEKDKAKSDETVGAAVKVKPDAVKGDDQEASAKGEEAKSPAPQ